MHYINLEELPDTTCIAEKLKGSIFENRQAFAKYFLKQAVAMKCSVKFSKIFFKRKVTLFETLTL